MFVFNDGNHDQRVHKQAQALGKRGYQVRVYCFLTAGQKPKEQRDGYLLLREDQRSHQARFFDDHIMGRLKRRRRPQESAPDGSLIMPVDRTPQRPCPKPVRELEAQAPAHRKDHWKYIERINRVWAERAKRWKPDLVQAHDLDALRAATILGKELDIPVIYDTHDLDSWLGARLQISTSGGAASSRERHRQTGNAEAQPHSLQPNKPREARHEAP